MALSRQIKKTLTIPEVKVYDANRREDIVLKDVNVDTSYVCDDQDKAMYFNLDEARAYLGERGKSLSSLPLLVKLPPLTGWLNRMRPQPRFYNS